jgi:signal transduction histidine kinase
LVVVSQVVADHGGRIEVETARGRGARFRLVLPAAGHDENVEVENDTAETETIAGD